MLTKQTPAHLAIIALLLASLAALHSAELHVSVTGNDSNPGTQDAALRTIQHAADLAQPGDTITVHAGVYRERINPPRGGESDTKRITYQAAPGEKVEIKGSEVVSNWVKAGGDTWKTTIPNSFFGSFNPYSDVLSGEWFGARGRVHHSGAIYLNGDWLTEAAKLEEVQGAVGKQPLWFGKVEGDTTTIWAQFKSIDPNEQTVELNVRQSVFYPSQPGRNYITVRGFTMRDAATPWAGAQSEQIGLIGTHWSKGWVIENNTISHSVCTGVTLGLAGFGQKWPATAPGYVRTIEYALKEGGWSKANIGSHIVRNNHISHCEKNAIHGSLGGSFSVISGNTIHDIHVRALFAGADEAGIKFLGGIDVEISRNRIYRTNRGLWMDWMAQGARITGNLFYENSCEDIYLEVNHGPYLVDNNIFLSPRSVNDWSEGGAFIHNLFAGKITSSPQGRLTPFHPAHSTALAGLVNIKGSDNRFYNNIFIGQGTSDNAPAKPGADSSGYGLWVYDTREIPLQTGGNVYYSGARPYAKEAAPLILSDLAPKPAIIEKDGSVYLKVNSGHVLSKAATTLVTTELLGKAKIPGVGYENPDGSPLKVDADYFGKKRNVARPGAGPFETVSEGDLKVWPIEVAQ